MTEKTQEWIYACQKLAEVKRILNLDCALERDVKNLTTEQLLAGDAVKDAYCKVLGCLQDLVSGRSE